MTLAGEPQSDESFAATQKGVRFYSVVYTDAVSVRPAFFLACGSPCAAKSIELRNLLPTVCQAGRNHKL